MATLRSETCPRCDGQLFEVEDIYGTDQDCWCCGYAGPVKEPDPIPAKDLCPGSGHLPKRIETFPGMPNRAKVPACDACGRDRFLTDGMISPHVDERSSKRGRAVRPYPVTSIMRR